MGIQIPEEQIPFILAELVRKVAELEKDEAVVVRMDERLRAMDRRQDEHLTLIDRRQSEQIQQFKERLDRFDTRLRNNTAALWSIAVSLVAGIVVYLISTGFHST